MTSRSNMTSTSGAKSESFAPFPNKSTALYRGNKQLRKGRPEPDTRLGIGLHDMRAYPAENGKGGNAISYRHNKSNIRSNRNADNINSLIVELPDTNNDLKLWTDMDGGRTCALLRSTTMLHAASTWRDLSGVEELTIEDEEGELKVLPAEIATLRALRVMAVRWSPLKFIGPEVSRLELTQLCLDRNKLKNIDPVCNIKSLTELNVSSNLLEVLPEKIGNLSYLRELDVSGNKLRELPASIGRLSLLSMLITTSNRLMSLPSSIEKLTDVTLLDVSANRLREIPNEIGKMESLVCLIASHNKLLSLPETLPNCTKLESVFLRMNQFMEVPEVLSRVPNLKVLNLRDNFIESMKNPMQSLTCLILDMNNFEEFPDAVFACNQLESLSMIGNTINTIPLYIASLKKLRRLYLGANEIKEIPSVIGELVELRHLYLEDNNISSIPFQIHYLTNLSSLRLDKSKLQGSWAGVYSKGLNELQKFAARLERGSVLLVTQQNKVNKDSVVKSPDMLRVTEERPQIKSNKPKISPILKKVGRSERVERANIELKLDDRKKPERHSAMARIQSEENETTFKS